MKQRVAVLLMLGMMPWTGLHAQQSASTTFRVAALVEAACEVAANNLEFGTHDAQGRALIQGTTLLRATCSPDSIYSIGLNEGPSPGATVNQRRMVSGASAFNYQLHSDAGTDTVIGVGTGTSQDHRVFGAVLAAQVIPAGGHADTITVRIYY